MANTNQQDKRFGQTGEQMHDEAKDTATSVMDKAKEIGSNIGDKAKEFAQTASQRAGNVNVSSHVGAGMESLGETIREHSPGGRAGEVASRVADNLERGGHYVREKELKGMANDLADVIRRNPVPAILIGVGLGYLLARAIRR
jgi:hypothetical protein